MSEKNFHPFYSLIMSTPLFQSVIETVMSLIFQISCFFSFPASYKSLSGILHANYLHYSLILCLPPFSFPPFLSSLLPFHHPSPFPLSSPLPLPLLQFFISLCPPSFFHSLILCSLSLLLSQFLCIKHSSIMKIIDQEKTIIIHFLRKFFFLLPHIISK